MGGKSEKGETMDWTNQNTKVFIEIIYDRVKKRQLQGSTFKMTTWADINNELCKITGATTPYGVDRLKGKFNPNNNFPKPQGDQFYLVDSGFPNIPGYHLRDFRDGGRAQGKQELFNHRHSSLRNIIERCFGVLKVRFPILKLMPNYPIRRQRLIPIACCTIHNFIRMQYDIDTLFDEYAQENLIMDEQGLRVDQEGVNMDANEVAEMTQVRKTIANQMWEDYNRS